MAKLAAKIPRTLLRALAFYYRLRSIAHNRGGAARTMARHRRAFYARIWQEAAARTGSSITPLGADIFEIRNGSRKTRVCLNYSPLDDSVTLRLAGNKPLTYEILDGAGIPTPRHIRIASLDLESAASFLGAAAGPVVVKPGYGTGAGAGVTTNITSLRRLANALAWSAAFCRESLVEAQVAGDNYRLLYLDGELIDCVMRGPPTVTGDGKSSIKHLVRKENRRRVKVGQAIAQALLTLDPDLRNTLAARGLSVRSVPKEGEIVRVKTVINGNRGNENHSARERACPELVELGRRAAELIGARLAGVDVITPDPGRPLAEAGGAVVDVNTTPGYYYHDRRDGDGFSAAACVLRHILEDDRGSRRGR